MYSLHFHAQVGSQLPAVQFGNDNTFVPAQYLGSVLWKRVQIPEVCQSHLSAFDFHYVKSRMQVAVSTAKAYDKHVCVVGIAFHLEVGHRNHRNLACAQVADD